MNKREKALKEFQRQTITKEERKILERFEEEKLNCQKIKELRTFTGMSQSQFADHFEIPVRTLQEWEQGRKIPATYFVNLLEKVIKMNN